MNYLEKAKIWKDYKNLDSDLKDELEKLSDFDLKEHFTTDLEFGTGGLRGVLGVGTNRINVYIVKRATLGFGRYLLRFENALEKGVCISYDNRLKSKEFSLCAAKVLASLGFRVYLFEDLRPTPELSFAVRHFKACAGIMITASHNPKEYNGYKIYDETGCQLVPSKAIHVIEEINKITDMFNIEDSLNHHLITYIGKEIDRIYLDEVNKIKLRDNVDKDFKVVYSPLHGTGLVFAKELLEENGYNVITVDTQMTSDPYFSGVLSSNPEEQKAYTQAIELAKENNASLIVITDPDADRLGVCVLHKGEYHFLNGNQSACLLLDYILKTRKELNSLPNNGYVFTTNVSSSLGSVIAKKYNMNIGITLTGFKFIGEKALEIENNGEYVFGFEESYGCLISDMVRDKDSFQAMLMTCEMTAYYKSLNKTLIDALEDVYKEYGYFIEGITNITLKGLEGSKKIKEIMNFFRENDINLPSFKQLSKEDCNTSIKYDYVNNTTSVIDLPKSNVIKYILNDDMWFVLRPSGTEPKLKVYYGVKGQNSTQASNLLDLLGKEVLEIVNKI